MKVGVFCNISALPFSHCISAAKKPFQFGKASKGSKGVGRRPTVNVVPPGPTDARKLEDQVDRLFFFYMGEEAHSAHSVTKYRILLEDIHQGKNPESRNKANQDIQKKALQFFKDLLYLPMDLPIEQFIEPDDLVARGKALLQIHLGLAPNRPLLRTRMPNSRQSWEEEQSIKIPKDTAIDGLFKKEDDQWVLTTDISQEFDGVDPDPKLKLEVGKTYTIHKIVLENEESLSHLKDAKKIDDLFRFSEFTEQLELTVSWEEEETLFEKLLKNVDERKQRLETSRQEIVLKFPNEETFFLSSNRFQSIFSHPISDYFYHENGHLFCKTAINAPKFTCSQGQRVESLAKNFVNKTIEVDSADILSTLQAFKANDSEFELKITMVPLELSSPLFLHAYFLFTKTKIIEKLFTTYDSFHRFQGLFTNKEHTYLDKTFWNVHASIIQHFFTLLETSTNETELKNNYDNGNIVFRFGLVYHPCRFTFQDEFDLEYEHQLAGLKQRILKHKVNRELKSHAQPKRIVRHNSAPGF